MPADSRLHAANLLSASRVACAPILLVLAWHGERGAFLALFALGLASDVLDGALARRLGQETPLGARLDQWGDFALWTALPLGAWWLWPEIIAREKGFLAVALVCMLLPTGVAYARYRAVPGYHSWSVKLGSILMGIGVALLLVADLSYPFRVAALFQIVCAIDELGITSLLPDCRNDVPSVFHAARMRRGQASRSAPGA
jgi:CDP-diacylglycerol--glycerol-3-phosphate 3-phosphatidyltransferase